MPLKTDTIEEPNLNLTPMIDIVFLLIIFFMVGTQFAELERQFDVQLPSAADVQPLTGRPDDLVINVYSDGRLVLNGDDKTIEQLETELVAARENYEDQTVVIRGEGEGRYQHVIDVFSACTRAKIAGISVAYERATEGK